MKFWELVSIMRGQPEDLENLLRDEKWTQYACWYADLNRIVDEQDRGILDSAVPEELAFAAMERFRERFQVRNGYLCGCPQGAALSGSLSALETYKRFGGTAIEDTLERGSAKISELA
jgi:hypothetical protein